MIKLPLEPKQKIFAAALIYIIWVIAFTYNATVSEKESLYQQLDEQLVSAALTAELLLPESHHRQDMKAGDISKEQDATNRFKLSEYTEKNSVSYIYTLIARDNNVYFTSSSATSQERESGENLSYYFDHYDDVDHRVLDIFNSKKKTFLEYTDQWGTFRSVFIPAYSADGTFYLTVADYSIEHIGTLVSQKRNYALLIAAMFLLLAYPLYRTALYREKQLLKELDEKAKQQTVALDKSEIRLKQALKSANQTWFEINLKTNDITVSDEYRLLGFGNSDSVFPVQAWQQNIHPEDVVATMQLFNHGIQTGESITMEYRSKSYGEHWIWLQSSAEIVLWDENNKPLMMVGINNNITDRKRAEDASIKLQNKILQNHKLLLELAKETFKNQQGAFNNLIKNDAEQLQIARVSVWLLNEDKSILTCQALYDQGVVSNEPTTRQAVNYPNYFSALNDSGFISSEDAQSDPLTKEWTQDYLLPLGITSLLDIPIRIQGHVIGVVCHEHIGSSRTWSLEEEEFTRSIAELCSHALLELDRKQAQDELSKHQQQLEELVEARTQEMKVARDEAERANQAKSEFLSSMSHELRTPMNAILGFTQILHTDPNHPLNDEQLESVDYIQESGEHLLELIDSVLNLSKIETGHADIVINECNVNELISQVMSLMKPEALNTSIALVNNAIELPTVYVKADYTKLKQILLNFTSNAIKYNCEQGSVHFTYSVPMTNKVRIEVSDTGQGVSEESFPAMFEPFNRLTMANSPILGTGIGLTICKEFVELMDGQIGVFNNTEKGLTFWVEFERVDVREVS